MITFLVISALAIGTLLAVQAMDVECVRPRRPRRGRGFARRIRVPLRVAFRNMLESEAR